MNRNHGYEDLTLSQIRVNQGITEPYKVVEYAPLSVWYGRIQNIKIKDLSDGDLARVLRQKIFLRYCIPEALYRLGQNPLAGELYDAEIIISLYEIPIKFWNENIDIASDVRKLLLRIKEGKLDIPKIEIIIEEEPEKILDIIDRFQTKLAQIIPDL